MSVTDFAEVATAFERHLRTERNLAVHSIRAYLGDLESLFTHLQILGVADISHLELSHIRSWLANMQVKGSAHLAFASGSLDTSFYKVGFQIWTDCQRCWCRTCNSEGASHSAGSFRYSQCETCDECSGYASWGGRNSDCPARLRHS